MKGRILTCYTNHMHTRTCTHTCTHAHAHTHTHPVCLSPMISSLCPLPMGTRESTALIPVIMGSRTEMRGMMPGAFVPTRARVFVSMGPCQEQEVKRSKENLEQQSRFRATYIAIIQYDAGHFEPKVLVDCRVGSFIMYSYEPLPD